MMISYAQEHEDVLLRRAFPRDHLGFYIDAGANDPVRFSVTKHFYDHGWRGINIEPVLSGWQRLQAQRSRDVNLNVGLSDREGRFTFHEVPSETTWSTFSAKVAEVLQRRGVEVRTHEVLMTTLARVCEEHVSGVIDILKIDVEAHELEVISGGDWVRWRPRVVLVENNGAELWEPRLMRHGYTLAVSTAINRFYVRDEDRALLPVFRAPIGPEDCFIEAEKLEHLDVMRGLGDEVLREMRAAQSRGEVVGPTSLRAALRLRRLAARHPRLAVMGRALARLAPNG